MLWDGVRGKIGRRGYGGEISKCRGRSGVTTLAYHAMRHKMVNEF